MAGMNITVNNRVFTLADGAKIHDLLALQKIDPAVIVVEVNRVIVKKENFRTTALHDNDEVEILRFVGGG
ncbi:MAG: sulfur carrier protein ThiS [Chitinispirillaceae bacterium]|jgi:sulfur carrier protein